MTSLPVAIDLGGGDLGFGPVLEAVERLANRVPLLLVGHEAAEHRFHEVLRRPQTQFRRATDVISMDDSPVNAAMSRRGSTLHVAAQAVAAGDACAMVTPGNTGAAVLVASMYLRRIEAVPFPALAVALPTPTGGLQFLVDAGASVDCRSEWLVAFARMGCTYARLRTGRSHVTFGLLSNGSEETKGPGPIHRAHDQLRNVPGYIGRVEGYSVLSDDPTVVVCDGFTGDVVLKVFERVASVASTMMLDAVSSSAVSHSEAAQRRLYVDGGAPLLGLRNQVVICHGEANPEAIVRAVERAAWSADIGLADQIEAALPSTARGQLA